MGTLNAALAWAARGFPVFPLRENTREPALDNDWNSTATTDPDVIRAMWTDPVLRTERNYNIGCVTTDYVVIDVDVKKGKDGYNEYLQMGGVFDTLVIRTTTGGYHCYFHGPDSNNASLSAGVDVRSHRGYVVAPGSVIDGHPYTIERDADLAWVPAEIERRLVGAYERNEGSAAEAYDTEAAIQGAINFLNSAPVAVEGQRGDETTFVTAARLVREMALTAETAFDLLLTHWNPRCQPPWDPDELWHKVENAVQYGSADEGRLTPETLFGHFAFLLEPPPSLFEVARVTWGNAMIPLDIKPRPWLVERMLMLTTVTVLLAPGSAGKSSFSLALAAHMALGLPFAGHQPRHACKTIVYNGEDNVEEQSRRLLAVCIEYQLDYEQVRNRVMLLSARTFKMQLAMKDGPGRPIRNDALISQIVDVASDPEVGLLILDPLVKIHQCNENDNNEMDMVMEILTDIAEEANIAVLVLHHTGKADAARQEDRIGNADIARGATAVVNAARMAFTLLNASKQDAEDYGFPDAERHMYVRLDDAKMNLTLAGKSATWFKRTAVKILSQDIVGVLSAVKLEKSRVHIKARIAGILVSSMELNGQGSLTMPQVVSLVKEQEPLWANKTDAEVRRNIEGFYTTPTTFHGKTIQLVREGESNKPTITLR